jgi:sulfotransferase family protein
MTGSSRPAAGAIERRGRVPDFFIVGHAKCGTTALYEMLKAHPQIFMPAVKEPQFFARNPLTPEGSELPRSFEQTGRRRETLDQYLSLFAGARAEELVGEASTFYLWSRPAPGRIAALRPDAKIIAILREPASFLYSLHLQMLQNHAESELDLGRAMSLEAARRRGEQIPPHAYWPEALMYSERVRYVEQLRRYHSVFPKEQVLVLIYDDFKRENEQTVKTVLRFLGVEETVALGAVSANPTVAVRSVRLRSAVREVRQGSGPVPRAVRGAVLALTSSRVRRELLHPLRRRVLYSAPQPPDGRLMLDLRRRFKSEVEELSEHLGRDLVAEWGYDRSG